MPEFNTFQTSPRDYALELVEESQLTADHLALCCLKYMSHDDVRGMLEANELAPNCCDECGESCDDDATNCEECQSAIDLEAYLEPLEGSHDLDSMRADIENGNLDVGDDPYEYEHGEIVRTSIENGQFEQAKRQCESYSLDYDSILSEVGGE